MTLLRRGKPIAKRRDANRELAAFRRRIKATVVDAARKGWCTAEQAQFFINRLGLRHE